MTYRRKISCIFLLTSAGKILYRMTVKPNQVRRLRTKMGMNQTELARELGVSKAAVSQWERGETSMRKGHAKLLARIAKERGAA